MLARTGDLRATEQHLEVLRETVAKEDKEPTKWKELSSSEKDAARAGNKRRATQSQLVPLAFLFPLFFSFFLFLGVCFLLLFHFPLFVLDF
jgi:hypothetical protein